MNRFVATSLTIPLALSIGTAAHGQSLYRDPNGQFTMWVPKGWTTQPQGDQGISVVNEKYQASITVGVMKGPDSSTPSPQKELDGMQGQLGQGCEIDRRGPITVASLSGRYFEASCMKNGSEEVMMFAATSGPGVMLVLSTSAPRSSLKDLGVTFGAIEHSINLGDGEIHTQWISADGQVSPAGSDKARQLAALKKACDTEALSKEECNQRMASLNAPSDPQAPTKPYAVTQAQAAQKGMSSNDPNFNPNNPNDPYLTPSSPNSNLNPPSPSRTGVYRDSQGRYSLTVPQGWTATPMNDGSGTLKLAKGPASATVTLMTWAGGDGANPSDIVMGIANTMKSDYHNPELAGEGDFQANGHPAHGLNATGIDSKGVEVVVAIIGIQISGPNFLSIVSSTPIQQANPVNDQIMKMVRSIRFADQ